MKRIFAAFPLLLGLLLMAHLCYAPPLPPIPSEGAPLDGFAVLLIASGALYGGYRSSKKD